MHISIAGRETAMTPDGSVVWERHEQADGVLYLPPDAPQEHANLVLYPPSGSEIGRGNSGGRVYETDSSCTPALLVKEFSEPTVQDGNITGEPGGLPTLRADVMLTAGLARIKQTGAWRFRGAEIFGAFVLQDPAPTHRGSSGLLHARWLMRRAMPVAGIDPYEHMEYKCRAGYYAFLRDETSSVYVLADPTAKPTLPNSLHRRKLYTRALLSVGSNQ